MHKLLYRKIYFFFVNWVAKYRRFLLRFFRSLRRRAKRPSLFLKKRSNKFSKLRSQFARDCAAPLVRRHFKGPSGSIPELCHEMDSLRPAVSKLQGKTERADSLPMPWSLFSSCSLFYLTVSIVFLRGARTSHEHPTLWAPLWIHLRCGYCTARYTRRSSFLHIRPRSSLPVSLHHERLFFFFLRFFFCTFFRGGSRRTSLRGTLDSWCVRKMRFIAVRRGGPLTLLCVVICLLMEQIVHKWRGRIYYLVTSVRNLFAVDLVSCTLN